MKKAFLILSVLALILLPAAVFAADGDKPMVKFETKSHDFGNIREADGKVKYDFKFVNTSSVHTVILSASTTCGCTKADYPKHPVNPGDTAVINVTFNPKNYSGEFIKAVTVRTPNQRIKLKITGVVIPKSTEE